MKRALPLSVALSLLGAAACGNVVVDGHDGTTTPVGGTGGFGGSGAGGGLSADVTGTMIDRYFGEGSSVDHPVDLTQAPVEAYVWNDGAWTTYPGIGTAEGTFTIAGVPQGLLMVDVAGKYLYTTARTLDLGTELPGRPTAVAGSGQNVVGGTLVNQATWSANATFQWAAPNGSGHAYREPGSGKPGTTQPPTPWVGALIDASEGDMLYITQLMPPQQAANAQYTTIARYTSFGTIEQTDGVPVVVNGSFVDVPATATISLDFRASQFAALADEVSPGVASGTQIDLFAQPGGTAAGGLDNSMLLLEALAQGEDLSLSSIPYANPFTSWGELVGAVVDWPVELTAPGASSPGEQLAVILVTMPASMASAGPIVPTVAPPQAPQINGEDASGPLTGVGLTPVISWAPPALGQPTAYEVSVYQVANAGGDTTISSVAQIVTTTTSLPLPPGVLQEGSAYAFVVTAVVSPIDAATKPFHGSPTYAAADRPTGMVTP